MFVLGVVPEYQCAVKRKEKKAQKDKDKPVSSTNGSPEIRIDQDPVITIIVSIFLFVAQGDEVISWIGLY